MFKDNKYTKTYMSIISNYDTVYSGYTEVHHIIPKSLGGSDEPTNLVRLSARKHYLCHLLLPKMVDGYNRYRMLCALDYMTKDNKKYPHRYKSRTYHYHKMSVIKSRSENFMGDKNHFYGKTHTEESKTKMSINNATRHQHVRDKMSRARMGVKPHNYYKGWTQTTKDKISATLTGRKLSNDVKQKMSDTRSRKVWIYKIGEKSRHIDVDTLNEHLTNGWKRGRKPK